MNLLKEVTQEELDSLLSSLRHEIEDKFPTLSIGESPWIAFEHVEGHGPDEEICGTYFIAYFNIPNIQERNHEQLSKHSEAYTAPFEELPLFSGVALLDREIAKWRLQIGK